jgi:hypothetical protein
MLVKVAQLFEECGRPLPRHRSITLQPVHVGHLSLSEQYDKEFRRSVVFAILRGGPAGADVLPRLFDAVVRWIGDGHMTISGFQIDEATKKCTVQSWYVEALTDRSCAGSE